MTGARFSTRRARSGDTRFQLRSHGGGPGSSGSDHADRRLGAAGGRGAGEAGVPAGRPAPTAGRKRKQPGRAPRGHPPGLAGRRGGGVRMPWLGEARDLVRPRVDLTGCQPGSQPPPPSGSLSLSSPPLLPLPLALGRAAAGAPRLSRPLVLSAPQPLERPAFVPGSDSHSPRAPPPPLLPSHWSSSGTGARPHAESPSHWLHAGGPAPFRSGSPFHWPRARRPAPSAAASHPLPPTFGEPSRGRPLSSRLLRASSVASVPPTPFPLLSLASSPLLISNVSTMSFSPPRFRRPGARAGSTPPSCPAYPGAPRPALPARSPPAPFLLCVTSHFSFLS